MKTILTLVLSLGVLFVKAQDSLSTFYFQPVMSVSIVRSEWELPYDEPLLMFKMLHPDYHINEGALIHKQSGLKIEVRFMYASESEYKETLLNLENSVKGKDIFNADFTTFSRKYKFVYHKDPNFAVLVKTNCSSQDSLRLPVLREFMSTVKIVDPSVIDKAIGYPADLSTLNMDSLRAKRREVYRKALDKNVTSLVTPALRSDDDKKFDSVFMNDVNRGFSYARFHKEMVKDVSRSYTTDEYLAYWFSPDSLKPGKYINTFRSRENFDIARYAGKEFSRLRKYKTVYNWTDQESFDENNDRGFVLLENDSMWNLLYAEKGKDTWTIKDHNGKKGRAVAEARSRPFELYYSDDNKEFILAYMEINAGKPRAQYQEPTSVSVVDTKNGLHETIQFSKPEKWNTYPMIIEYRHNSERRIKKYEYSEVSFIYDAVTLGSFSFIQDILYGKTQMENKSGIPAHSKDYYNQWKPEQRLFVSPVFFTDLDEDGKTEVWRAFVSNGKIVFSEVFERGDKGNTKITMDEMWKQKLIKYPPFAAIIKRSESIKWYSTPEIMEVDEVDGNDELVEPGEQKNYIDEEKVEYESPVSAAEVTPTYPGGDQALHAELKSLTIYPETELQNKIEGTVFVQMVVEKDGTITGVKTARGVSGGPGLSKAAEDAVKKLSKPFTPAKQNGKVVRCTFIIPVKFKL